MERTMSVEDKIKRAEEIYNRRRENQIKSGTAKVSINNKKDLKLLKKMFIQIAVCLVIYSVFYLVKNNNYIFSEDFLNKTKEILSYDVNFQEIYSKILDSLRKQEIIPQEQKQTEESIEETEQNQENTEESGIGGAEENGEENNQDISGLSQMEQDALNIKKSINFINPIEGTVTSIFGWREPTTNTVPKYHTGLDIANVAGTQIYSSTDGDVILASSQGDYR